MIQLGSLHNFPPVQISLLEVAIRTSHASIRIVLFPKNSQGDEYVKLNKGMVSEGKTLFIQSIALMSIATFSIEARSSYDPLPHS